VAGANIDGLCDKALKIWRFISASRFIIVKNKKTIEIIYDYWRFG
jgi:hypothetical protein